jgi:dihydrofolate reductase
MAKLIYSAIASLDGYVADREGGFDWAAPSDEVHAFLNDLERPVGTYLYGRRMYDVMAPWETMDTGPDQPAAVRDFAGIWRGADKVVFSRTLERPTTTRTRVERDLDPARVRALKTSSSGDLTVGGPGLAGQAMRAALVDELQIFLVPVVVGGGTRFLPDDARLDLELLDERRFGDGTVFLRYRSTVSSA